MQVRTTICAFIFGFLLSSLSGISQTSLEGKVIDASSGDVIIFATVALYKNEVLITTGETDLDGNFYFTTIDPGTYDVEASSIGYTTQRQSSVIVLADKTTLLDFTISEGLLMDAVEIIEYKVPLIDLDYSTSGNTVTAEAIRSLPTKNITGMATSSSLRSGSKRHRVASGTSLTSNIAVLPKSGQMTAGEWNDLHNWKDWQNLLENENYSIMTDRFEIYPIERYSIVVVNNDKQVIPNVPVSLLDKSGNIIWTAVTDNSGKAELWSNSYSKTETADRIEVEGKTINDIVSIDDGSNTIAIDRPCSSPTLVDIAFTIDATSSMSDEIDYLKSELLDVITRIKENNGELDFRLSSVFYRDAKDEYLTRVFEFNKNEEELISFIKNQNARGGGDIPEAVDAALDKTLNLDWREGALKIAFLILDAPPHEDLETLTKIRGQIKLAAAKGIKIIPITASGINRETEFLMKFIAMMTNGTYVFITEDSGIGNPHLDPVVKDYEVEKLNDCIVRLISQNSRSYSCEAETRSVEGVGQIQIFPNPTTQYINVKTESIPIKIKVLSSGGMVVRSIIPTTKETRIEMEEFVNGVYIISIDFDNHIESRQVILLK